VRAAILIFVVAAAGLSVWLFLRPVYLHPNSWRPDSYPYTTTQPKQGDVAGSYVLTRQTVTTDGLSVLHGRKCQLDLHPDGSFGITNFPVWTQDPAAKQQVTAFVSTTGHWTCDKIGSMRDQSMWGVRFQAIPSVPLSGLAGNLMALIGKQTPYDLETIEGDPDEDAGMVFEKKR
jgi:hypothetical protein